MHNVYFLRSLQNPKKTYIGCTVDIQQRIAVHNSGGSAYTKPARPWELVAYVVFESEEKAAAFEKYAKTCSGRAFAKRHIW